MWVNLLISIVISLALSLLRPKPQPPKPSTLNDFKIPVTEEGEEITVCWGTNWVTPQIHWYGDLKTEAIKTKQAKK